jgi:cytochrome oxidase Cu insertion factor (SCO1/SenC/PrrC family)
LALKAKFRLRELVLVGALGLTLFLASPGTGSDENHFSAVNVVRFAKPVTTPDFKLADIQGNVVSFSSLKGKVVLLNFWTTW